MIFQNEDKIHGAMLRELLLQVSIRIPNYFVRLTPGYSSRSAYFLETRSRDGEHSKRLGLFIKTSSNRRSPWKFSFTDMHQLEISELNENSDEVFILFAAGDDGVACISFDRLKQVLDEEYDPVEWIDIRRRPRQSYRISGSNGKAERPVARNAFPNEIIDYLAS